MKLKISAGLQAVLPTGPYQNMKPNFQAEIELDCAVQEPLVVIKKYQEDLYAVCQQLVRQVESAAIVERINRERQDMHWIDDGLGNLMPSVTSVIDFDSDMFCSPEDLQQYASQSCIVHKQVEVFIATKEWKKPKEIPDCWSDIVVLTKGKLQLAIESGNFLAFLEKFPIMNMQNAIKSKNLEHRYGGTPDFTGIPVGWYKMKGFEHVMDVPTLFDVKRTKDVPKNGKQLSAYKRMEYYQEIEQICVVEINDKTQQGFSKPEVFTKEQDEGFFKMFLRDREGFKKRFGV